MREAAALDRQPPLTPRYTNAETCCLKKLSDIHRKGSAPKRKADVHLQSTHANYHWLVLLTLKGDWALGRDPIYVSHYYVTSNMTA